MTPNDSAKSTVPTAPHFVIYSDQWTGTQPPDPSLVKVTSLLPLLDLVTSIISRDILFCEAF